MARIGSHQTGFSIIELIVVLLVVGVLAAAAVPLYLGYTRQAKTAEAKVLAGSLWTAVTADAVTGCGTVAVVSAGYPKAGLDASGSTVPPRWAVTVGGGNTVMVDCATGALTADGDIFTINGTASDVTGIRVRLTYRTSATPPSRLRCSEDGGLSFVDC